MTFAWPTSVPAFALRGTFGEIPDTAVARFDPPAGRPIARARSRIDSDALSFNLGMLSAQLAAFIAFYEDTLSFGTQPFTMTHPRTFAAATKFTFTAPPSIKDVGYGFFQVAIKIRKMP